MHLAENCFKCNMSLFCMAYVPIDDIEKHYPGYYGLRICRVKGVLIRVGMRGSRVSVISVGGFVSAARVYDCPLLPCHHAHDGDETKCGNADNRNRCHVFTAAKGVLP